jgi:cyclomaltodextrinase / maltogenic alpha-amylase / neopullulanase
MRHPIPASAPALAVRPFEHRVWRNASLRARTTVSIVALLVIVLIPAFGRPQSNATAEVQTDSTAWTKNLSVYEVNVRQYTKAGTFAAFGTHLDRLKDLGAGILWFMPIHPIGVKNRIGSLGSYYSVKNYYGVNPEFGTLDDFKALVDSIHSKGMFVIIDWVANHTSWDNDLTLTHPEYYQKSSSGAFIAPPGTNWTDVIQLNYYNPDLRTYMIDAMKYWITETHIDGFRFDAASMVPVGFWTTAAAELRKVKPDVFLIAEDQDAKYYPAGLNATYAWSYYGFGSGILIRLAKGTNNANSFHAYVANENSQYPGNSHRLYFTSNHDENSWYGTDTELFGSATESFIALSLVFRSIPLIYSGQEAGLNHRLQFFDKDEIVWQASPRANVYSTLLHLKTRNSALWNGTFGGDPRRVSTTSDVNVYAFEREHGADKVCGVFNLSSVAQTFMFTDSAYAGTYRDVFTDSTIALSLNSQMTLPAWGYHVFEFKQVADAAPSDAQLPRTCQLFQNYPNPFNPSTTIRYELSQSAIVRLSVFTALGREVATLQNGRQAAGYHEVRFDGTGLSSGVYFYRIQAGEFLQTKKLVLLR